MRKTAYTLAGNFTYAAIPNSKPKAAFTLAEVLITLGIIGVVAAMTMPAVIGNYKKHETISRLKKAYTIINQALTLSENDNGEYEYWDEPGLKVQDFLNKYWLPYFNVLKVCNTYSTCGYESNYPWVNTNGSSSSSTFTSPTARIPFLTSDGILYSISIAAGSERAADSSIYIDLNGPKAPNTFGKDLFLFKRVAGKGIVPYGYNETSKSIDNGCSKSKKTGQYCAAKIMKDGWQILSDYPY